MDAVEVVKGVFHDGFSRTEEGVPEVIEGLSVEELLWRPDAGANSIAWLVWHLSRQQDEQVADLAAADSVWVQGGWATRFALPYPPDAQGYGMTSEDVAAFRLVEPSLLAAYNESVNAATRRLVDDLTLQRFVEVIDEAWDPPVTVAVRLVSVMDDAAKHLGQAEYVRGLLLRRRP